MRKDVRGSSVIHYGWIVMAMGLLTTIGAHGFGRMAYTLILPSMKDGLRFTYAQLGLLGTGNFIGYLSMAIIRLRRRPRVYSWGSILKERSRIKRFEDCLKN